MVNGCLSDTEVALLLVGTASSTDVNRAFDHAATCELCRELLTKIGRVRAVERRGEETSVAKPEPGLDNELVAPGVMLGRYRLEREIGRGGMGIVFEAHDPELDRRVAVKLLSGAKSSQLARISREAQAVARLSHPNVVQVFDVDLANDRAFIVMELLDGITLGDWVATTRPSWRRILDAYAQAGEGLAAAHAAGLVHRDFKPANAIIDRQGHVKVLDFGLARSDGEGGDSGPTGDASTLTNALTAPGTAVGTPSYMAPEQHRGERVDARADIYAFGAALFEALHGSLPFDGRTIGHLALAKRRGIQREREERSIPAPVRAAIAKALGHDPHERWSSMQELLAALRVDATHASRAPWLLGGAIALGIAVVPFVAHRDGETEGAPASAHVDTALESYARALIEQSRAETRERDRPRAIGTALAASTIAAASRSRRTQALAEIATGEALGEVGAFALAVAWLRTGIEHAGEAGEDAMAARAGAALVHALGALDRADEATEAGRVARAHASRADDRGDLLADILTNEAGALPEGRDAEAIDLLEQALVLRRQSPEPGKLAVLLHDLGTTLRYWDHRRARRMLEESLAIQRTLANTDDAATLQTELMLLTLDAEAGNYGQCSDHGARMWTRAPTEDPVLRSTIAEVVAQCCGASGEAELGLRWVRRALELPAELTAETHDRWLDLLALEAMLMKDVGELARAEERFQELLVLRERRDRRPSRSVAEINFLLAGVVLERGELERARVYAARAVEELGAVEDHQAVSRARLLLAQILHRQARYADVLDALGGELDLPADPPVPVPASLVASARQQYAEALWELGTDHARALALAREALDTFERDDTQLAARDDVRAWLAERTPRR